MIAVVDYDAGNLRSVENALRYLEADAVISNDPAVIRRASKVILPGVGSFGDAMAKLDLYGLTETLRAVLTADTPFLGICLGLQLLFEESEESPGVQGLSFLKGKIHRFTSKEGYKIPQIGWNEVRFTRNDPLLEGIGPDPFFYFVHSYYARAEERDAVLGQCDYTDTADVLVKKGNVCAAQFHPERSGSTGLRLLKNFVEL